jgi:hypothetical protein
MKERLVRRAEEIGTDRPKDANQHICSMNKFRDPVCNMSIKINKIVLRYFIE